MRWISRENVKVDRVACPWLIKRFADLEAEFLFVPEQGLLAAAKREEATPFDATRFPEVALNHRGDRCTFEAILFGPSRRGLRCWASRTQNGCVSAFRSMTRCTRTSANR
jgi:hypothetical protein